MQGVVFRVDHLLIFSLLDLFILLVMSLTLATVSNAFFDSLELLKRFFLTDLNRAQASVSTLKGFCSI